MNSPSTPVRVLIVDDNDDQRELLSHFFERAGCEVVSVGTAEEATVAYAMAPFDLAVIDLVLPAMDGWALAEQIRADNPMFPVAITSVLGTKDYPRTQALLPKPVSGADVTAVLAACVPRWVAP